MSQNKMNNLENNKVLNLKKLSQDRTERAYAILRNGNPEIVNEQEFLVPASNPKYKYKVTHVDSWTCECPDFQERCKNNGMYCKHIKAIQFFLKLQNKVEVDELNFNIEERQSRKCPNCKSSKIVRNAKRKTKSGIKQRYLCKNCKKRFVLEPIRYIQVNAKILCLIMNEYFKGHSLRDIQDTLDQFFQVKLSPETVRRYISKFTKLMDSYVKTKANPETLKLGGTWQCDEQTIKVGKELLWDWNAIDTETKYLLANNITKSRYYEDMVKIASKSKEEGGRPDEFRTDGLQGYNNAVKEAFELDKLQFPYTVHIKSKGFRNEINTNLIERYHSEFREFDKIRRGFGNMDTAQGWNDGYRLFHNVIRKNMALNGLTPLEMAKVDLELGRNRWYGLLLKSLNC
ncbi:IS1/IS6 family transposase [Candidatus Woesearchaeota archaeon]|nr:IS1/IS6 family transposase [Candidatus Woesearchaeota archaeon]